MKKYIFALGLVFVGFLSCKTTKFVTPVASENSDSNNVTCVPIVKDTAGIYLTSDSFLLVNAILTGKCLEIEVEYTGGCGGDEWTLGWRGILLKSLPPKANIYLHLKNNDPCRETVRKKVSFDISSIYNGEVNLLLKDFRGVLVYKP